MNRKEYDLYLSLIRMSCDEIVTQQSSHAIILRFEVSNVCQTIRNVLSNAPPYWSWHECERIKSFNIRTMVETIIESENWYDSIASIQGFFSFNLNGITMLVPYSKTMEDGFEDQVSNYKATFGSELHDSHVELYLKFSTNNELNKFKLQNYSKLHKLFQVEI